jgi:hypothetical protein
VHTCFQGRLVEGRDQFPLAWIIFENLLHLAIWITAGALLWPIWRPFGLPTLTLLWAGVVVVVQTLLKKHNCSGCYYYDKWCHLGWGKLAAALFPKDSGDHCVAMRLILFYILPPPLILIAALAFGIFSSVSRLYWGLLVLYVLLNAVTFPVRKWGCGQCTLREACPGSAAKS